MIKFNLQGYKELMRLIKYNQFDCIGFDQSLFNKEKKQCLLRHDIDADLEVALKIATIESSLSIKSTYFIMLTSPFYNLLHRVNLDFVKKIIKLGHMIGLHFDANGLPDNLILSFIEQQIKILNNYFDIKIGAVSFHHPSSNILGKDLVIPNLINTYNQNQLKLFDYYSDSNKHWKSKTPEEMFTDKSTIHIQLLTHPIWWAGLNKDKSVYHLWDDTLLRHFHRLQSYLLNTERAYGNKRTFTIKS